MNVKTRTVLFGIGTLTAMGVLTGSLDWHAKSPVQPAVTQVQTRPDALADRDDFAVEVCEPLTPGFVEEPIVEECFEDGSCRYVGEPTIDPSGTLIDNASTPIDDDWTCFEDGSCELPNGQVFDPDTGLIRDKIETTK